MGDQAGPGVRVEVIPHDAFTRTAGLVPAPTFAHQVLVNALGSFLGALAFAFFVGASILLGRHVGVVALLLAAGGAISAITVVVISFGLAAAGKAWFEGDDWSWGGVKFLALLGVMLGAAVAAVFLAAALAAAIIPMTTG